MMRQEAGRDFAIEMVRSRPWGVPAGSGSGALSRSRPRILRFSGEGHFDA